MVAFPKGVEIENIVICWSQRTLEILKTFKTAQYVRFIDNFSSLEVFFVYIDYMLIVHGNFQDRFLVHVCTGN